MSITAQYTRVNQQELKEILSDPGKVSEQRLLEFFRRPGKSLDLDKEWEELHALLTGESLTESFEAAAQSMIRSNLAQAKENRSFPTDSLTEIEEAAAAVKETEKELRKLLRKTPWKLNTGQNEAEQKITFVPHTLSRQMLVIAGLRTHCPDEFIERCYDDLVNFGKGAKSVQAFIGDMLTKLRAKDYTQIMEICDSIQLESRRLHDLQDRMIKIQIECQKISVPQLTLQTKHQTSPLPDRTNLLSIAVSGNTPFPGTDAFSYIEAEQVTAINEKLESLTYKELASKTELDIDDFEDRFKEFKQFYSYAAKQNEVVLCMFG